MLCCCNRANRWSELAERKLRGQTDENPPSDMTQPLLTWSCCSNTSNYLERTSVKKHDFSRSSISPRRGMRLQSSTISNTNCAPICPLLPLHLYVFSQSITIKNLTQNPLSPPPPFIYQPPKLNKKPLGCQRETGSAFAINILIEADRVTLLQEEKNDPELEVVNAPSQSGAGQKISRCKKCHVAVWSTYGGLGPVVRLVRAGTLDQASLVSPDVHIYTNTKVPWLTFPDSVPVFEAFYGLEQEWPEESLARKKAFMPPVEEDKRQSASRKQ